MPDNVLSEDVRQFILDHIDSIAQLEGLLLLRANPHTPERVSNIAERLYIPAEEAELLLHQLLERGLLSRNETSLYIYKPRSADIDAQVTKLAETYARYLLAVTHFIHSKSKSRVQEFANAFRIIRKD